MRQRRGVAVVPDPRPWHASRPGLHAAAGGKGTRGVRSTGRAAVVDECSSAKIEVITANREIANRIADAVAGRFFDGYPGISGDRGWRASQSDPSFHSIARCMSSVLFVAPSLWRILSL